MIKAKEIAQLPEAITAACLAHCRKHGPAAAREVLRHLRLAAESSQSARSEALLAEMCAGIEELLRDAG